MKITVTCEQILYKTGTGEYWVQGTPLSFWERYCEVFDGLTIVGRVANAARAPEGSDCVCHPRISVAAIPYFRGSWQLARRYLHVRSALQQAASSAEALLMRVPSTLANLLTPALLKAGRPYALEVIGDPYDVFAPGVVKHPLRPLLREWFSNTQRRQCLYACGAAYVTESRLQARYPPAPTSWQTHYSSIALPDEAFIAAPRTEAAFTKSTFRLITVAKMAQMYKGIDVLLDAVAMCIHQGLELQLDIIGDGVYRKELMRHAAERGIECRAVFHGFIPSGEAVWRMLDRADLFVLPSRTEGLPRSMIEAMARGLPCLGTKVGGIPEMLPDGCRVPPNDAESLATRIAQVLACPAQLAGMSVRNREHVENYRAEMLRRRRIAFYERLRAETARWLAERC